MGEVRASVVLENGEDRALARLGSLEPRTGGSPIVRTAESPGPWLMIPRIDVIELTSGGAAQPRAGVSTY